jgi:hypothetical protein
MTLLADQLEKPLVHARIVGQFGVERGDEEAALAEENRLAVEFGQYLDLRACIAESRRADEDPPERLVMTREFEIGLEARNLPSIGVTVNGDVDQSEVLAVEHDHSCAGPQDGAAETLYSLIEAVETHEPHERGGLSTGDHQPVQPLKLPGLPNLDGLGAEAAQHCRMLAEVPLDG